jgi:putative hemolysin
MATPVSALHQLHQVKPLPRFRVEFAASPAARQQCYELRYHVFATELGAEVRGTQPGIDKDHFDDHSTHIAVFDNKTNELVATTRLLDNQGRLATGKFYSETEFDITMILQAGKSYLEIGRTCIHPDYRRGAALPMLWQGIARHVVEHHIDYLFGCASIPLANGNKYIYSVMSHLREKHFSAPDYRVRPLIPLRLEADGPQADDVILPTLLKAYLRQGAVICGEPYWDAGFGVADVFVLLQCDQLTNRYVKHFIDRI